MSMFAFMNDLPMTLGRMLAQVEATGPSAVRQWDYNTPATWDGRDWGIAIALVLAAVYVVYLYIRDTRALTERGMFWRVWMTSLRLGVLAMLAMIFLNPHERTETLSFRPSQVVLLVDTSESMSQPAKDPRDSSGGNAPPISRQAQVSELLAKSPLIDKLRDRHHVDVYTFDSDLKRERYRFLTRDPRYVAGTTSPAAANADGSTTEGTASEGAAASSGDPVIDWEALLSPEGASTRLGDVLDKLLSEVKGKSLSGVVVFSDGASNVGADWQGANRRAKENGVRLFTAGTGSTQLPLNLRIAKLLQPTTAQLGDPFDVTALVQSSGLISRLPGGKGRKTVKIELLEKRVDDPQPRVVDTADATIEADEIPVSVKFERKPEVAGRVEYTVRVAASELIETDLSDNVKSGAVELTDRPLKVFMIAGGPMRDFQFSKNALHRHKGVDVDIWLQSGGPGISQDAHEILFSFPSRTELFEYDVVFAFDPDWTQIPEQGRADLEEWVTRMGGGVILVAGDVYTPQLALASETEDPEFKSILNLYPVVLDEIPLRLGSTKGNTNAFQWGFTQEGKVAEFLQLTDDPSSAHAVWGEFPGVYRCYPTKARKGGTTVYSEFTDPQSRGRDGQPVLLASQRYGLGAGIYLGSPEVWRLRSLDEDYYDRFWIKLTRKASEGRMKTGQERATILLESQDYIVGQTVPIRVRAVDAEFRPLEQKTIDIQVFDPTGRPMIPAPKLQQDTHRPEEFFGSIRVSRKNDGEKKYRLELTVPGTNDVVVEELNVMPPTLEADDKTQNVSFLTQLAEGTGGRYLPVDDAGTLPELLPDMGHQIILDKKIDELWDEQWVLLVMGLLLAAEWLTRKLLKLA